MIVCKDLPNQQFETKEQLFKALKENEKTIIDLKKAAVKHSDGLKHTEIKNAQSLKAIKMDDNSIYAVINTTNVMDSHSDVHLMGIWNKSVTEQQGKVFYLTDHKLEVPSVITYPKNVKMYVERMQWQELGANYTGETEALIFEVNKEDIRLQDVKDIIREKIDIEHSVRMQYITIALALNDNDEDYKDQKAVWDKYINDVVNKEDAEKQGYFWAVTEAKIYKEGSMVLSGSNSITPLLQKDNEPSKDTHKAEPSDDTQNDKKNNLSIYTFN